MKNDLIDNFLDSRRLKGSSEATIRSYESRLRRFDQFLKAKPLEEAARKDVERYLNWMEGEGRAWYTISSYLSTAKIFFRWLKRQGGDDVPDLGELSAKSYPRRGRLGSRPGPLSREKVRKIIDGADNPRDALIIALLYFCGLRLCELEGMKRGQVITKERLIEVHGKCSYPRFRRVPYPRELDQLLEQYLERRSDWENDALEVAKKLKYGRRVLFLFPSRRDGYLSTSAIRKIVLRAAEKAGVQEVVRERPDGARVWKVTPSALRRAFKAHAVGDGVPREHVYIIMGYKKPSFHNPFLRMHEEAAIKSYRENFEGLGEEAMRKVRESEVSGLKAALKVQGVKEEKIDRAIRASGIELGVALGTMGEGDLGGSRLSGGLSWTVSTSES